MLISGMKIFNKISRILLFLLLFLGVSFSKAFAEEVVERYKAKVVSQEIVNCEQQFNEDGYQCVKYMVKILEGEKKDEKYTTNISIFSNEESLFAKNSKVYVSYSPDVEGNSVWRIESYSREMGILFLMVAFVATTLLVNGKQGIGATAGLILTFLVIYTFTIPMILGGQSIFWIGTLTVLIIILSSYLSHGINKKTTVGIFSMLIGTLFVFILGYFVLKALHLNGVGEESAAMIYDQLNGDIKLFDILLFSIVLGAVGVLDDVAIGQISSMQELISLNKDITFVELFKKSMNIGRDLISLL
jgi:uncharacterized membrane protein